MRDEQKQTPQDVCGKASVSTGREVSFEWPHHTIWSADSKVGVTLRNSIKYSSSERITNVVGTMFLYKVVNSWHYIFFCFNYVVAQMKV